MHIVVILNDSPYGIERPYNGLRLADNLLRKVEGARVSVFLLGDAAQAARSGQRTPNGYYNLERMLKGILAGGGEVLLCGTCMDARGLRAEDVVAGGRRSTLDELTQLTAAADKVLVF
ncbi:MAG TPA: DsrE family protein [Gemmatimonadales bacterium]|nr:DsrE family protein [Gemmatimonadales bacterium]